MHRSLLFAVLFVSGFSVADNPPTMRVDYFHTGDVDTEMFSLDRVVIEPLPFPGNMEQPAGTRLKSGTRTPARSPGRAVSAAFTANGKPPAKQRR